MSILEQTKSIEQVKQELGDLKYSQILRQTKLRQFKGFYSDGAGGFCARGVILNHFGWDGSGVCNPTFDKAVRSEERMLPNHIREEIVTWNDKYGLSFDQIADKLEEMGY